MNMTKAEIKYYTSLDPRDPDYLDIEEEQGEPATIRMLVEAGNADEEVMEVYAGIWADHADYIMTEAEKRGEL
jgi:hypothetical protein